VNNTGKNQQHDFMDLPPRPNFSAFPPRQTSTVMLAKSVHSSHLPPATPPPIWLIGKNLDFCLLAVCSCVLAVLCHQTVVVPSATVSSNSVMTSSTLFPSQLDFAIKAALFTSWQKEDEGIQGEVEEANS
jgi:hypothetical protein